MNTHAHVRRIIPCHVWMCADVGTTALARNPWVSASMKKQWSEKWLWPTCIYREKNEVQWFSYSSAGGGRGLYTPKLSFSYSTRLSYSLPIIVNTGRNETLQSRSDWPRLSQTCQLSRIGRGSTRIATYSSIHARLNLIHAFTWSATSASLLIASYLRGFPPPLERLGTRLRCWQFSL